MSTVPFIIRVSKYLPWIEGVLIVVLFGGAIGFYLDLQTGLIIVSLLGLSITYIVSAYKPIEIESNGDEKFGMKELLAWTILPKIAWIACGVSTLGAMMFFMNLNTDRHRHMLLVGALSLAGAIAVAILLFVTGVKQIKVLGPVSLRALPLLCADCYMLFV